MSPRALLAAGLAALAPAPLYTVATEHGRRLVAALLLLDAGLATLQPYSAAWASGPAVTEP